MSVSVSSRTGSSLTRVAQQLRYILAKATANLFLNKLSTRRRMYTARRDLLVVPGRERSYTIRSFNGRREHCSSVLATSASSSAETGVASVSARAVSLENESDSLQRFRIHEDITSIATEQARDTELRTDILKKAISFICSAKSRQNPTLSRITAAKTKGSIVGDSPDVAALATSFSTLRNQLLMRTGTDISSRGSRGLNGACGATAKVRHSEIRASSSR
mmetsp:Transcript_9344/g.18442  ORF Transcript_9344/g.18442 Transcript_9344/m.18442 type:complete len:220 (-) Transcript_9344:194-853(-)